MAVKRSKTLKVLDAVRKENAFKEVTIKLEVSEQLAEKIEYVNARMNKVLGLQPSKVYGKKFGEVDGAFFEELHEEIVARESEKESKKSGGNGVDVRENVKSYASENEEGEA